MLPEDGPVGPKLVGSNRIYILLTFQENFNSHFSELSVSLLSFGIKGFAL
jgi:hypothetical protein